MKLVHLDQMDKPVPMDNLDRKDKVVQLDKLVDAVRVVREENQELQVCLY